ncbi:MFS transporter [Corynebacterium halotolerans]|uniref:Major facilitator superfamily permease n=1 Tax=Corynebacterium halotolerans YIM 70093 = DSM 44683 TaxID=1121362 RepID=M1P9U2_9CORY|nr:MFS transporter [Corynebacterium halotolerans]AGF73431.1 major facilitator superfamily permease [Corynebacterium halotolerans YIM 70093 = DSM 44683]
MHSPGRAAWMIAVAAAAAFLATFNETFLNVAFTPIMEDFNVDVNTVQWLTTGYLLVAAVFVPVSNVLYHRFPTRPLFVAVVAIMVVGSVVGALAPTFSVLLIARLLQAIGTGLLTPIGMNITLAVSPREKLGLNMGIMAAMTTLGPSLAIVLSGALLTVAPWTTLMWVFGGLTLIVLLAGAIALRNVAELGRQVLDILSFLLVAVGLVGILYGVSSAFSGTALYAGVSAVIGLLALWMFVIRQRRIEHPLIDLRPFSSAPFVFGVLMTMLGLLFVFAMNVTIPLFLQAAHGMAPLGASLALAPGILLTVVMGPVAGRLFDRHGGRWSIPLGFLIMAVFVTLVGVAAGYSSILLFALLYIPAVLATAFVIGPSQTFALSHLDRETSPHGVTVVSTSFQIAGCVGTSLAAGIYGALTTANLNAGNNEFDSLLTGFRGAVVLVVVTSLIGILLAFLAYRSAQSQRSTDTAQSPENTVESIMKSDVYALSSDQTVLEALQTFAERGISGAPIIDTDGSLAGFLSDGDVMRYLSAAHPSSTSIYSYAIGADEDLEQAMSDLAGLNVMKLATHDVLTIDVGSSIADAVAAVSDAHIKKVPVVRGENGQVVGIVSRSAINRLAIAGYLHTRGEAPQMADATAR